MHDKKTIPPGWVWTTLGECASILDSQRVPINSEEREERIANKPQSMLCPYFGATGQVGWIDDYLFDEELVLLGEDGAPFLDANKPKAYLIRGKSWVNNHAHVLRAISDASLNAFLLHYLNIFDYHGYVTGTTRLKLNQAQMKKIPIPLAPLPEQRRIVAKIEELFTRLEAGVAALKRVQAALKRYRAAVLKAACEGRLVPQDPHDESASKLLARILAERESRRGDARRRPGAGARGAGARPAPTPDGLPELPRGWEWATVEQLAWDSGYGTSQKCDYESSGPPVLRIPNIVNGGFDFNDLKFATKADELDEAGALAPGDMLIIRTNGSRDLIGRVGLVRQPFEKPYFFASYLIRYRLVSLEVGIWLSTIWDADSNRRNIEQIAATSAGQYNVSVGSLNKIPAPLPPLTEQRRIVAEVERRLSVVQELEQTVRANLARAERLRQAILKRAFEGKLVPQDPADEPAERLLERIQANRVGATLAVVRDRAGAGRAGARPAPTTNAAGRKRRAK